jgi:hypothetical protein
MPTSDNEARTLENELQRELQETTARRQKLEEAINSLNVASNCLIEKAALQEIEAHRKQRPFPSEPFRSKPPVSLQAAIANMSVARFIEGKKEILSVAQSGGESLPLSPVRANATAKSSERILAWFHRTQK